MKNLGVVQGVENVLPGGKKPEEKSQPNILEQIKIETVSPKNKSVFKQKIARLKKAINETPKYVEKIAKEVINDYGHLRYNGGEFSQEYLAPFIHTSEIGEGIYLGNMRAFLSVDPKFSEQYPAIDHIDAIAQGMEISEKLKKEAEENLNRQLGTKGSSELGIKHVLSITQFKPAANVQQDDWSKFQPNLVGLGVGRQVVPIDDEEISWDMLRPSLEEAMEYIDQALENDEPILIHCVKGANRSATVLIAYLMSRCQVNFEEAYNYVKNKRLVVDVKPSMIVGLRQYEKELQETRKS